MINSYLSRILKASLFAEHKFAMQQCINDEKVKHSKTSFKASTESGRAIDILQLWTSIYTSVSSLLLLTQF